ncbi:MAG TPA: malonyl-ACP O-methyltransferase BioC [Gammaproteobacteria bacterium]|nr:malonyl-ACP O-methyltransferase BioC [Gammaproteobacteria bacterium]
MSGDPFALDRRRVRASFDTAAAGYDAVAVVQAEIRRRLLERLELFRIDPLRILDAGCGTGHGARALLQHYRRAEVVALDLAPGMLQAARRQRPWLRRLDAVCGDAAAIPLADGSVDLVFSNLMLQWCDSPDRVFAEVHRVLRPGGLLLFSSFGPDTLKELRAAWRAADGHTHVNRFIDMHDLGDALVRAGLQTPVMDMEYLTLTYRDVRSLMRDLRTMGASNATAGRRRGLTGRRRLAAVEAWYEGLRAEGRLPATWEVVYGHAWAGRPRSDQDAPSGEVAVPLSRIGRRP